MNQNIRVELEIPQLEYPIEESKIHASWIPRFIELHENKSYIDGEVILYLDNEVIFALQDDAEAIVYYLCFEFIIDLHNFNIFQALIGYIGNVTIIDLGEDIISISGDIISEVLFDKESYIKAWFLAGVNYINLLMYYESKIDSTSEASKLVKGTLISLLEKRAEVEKLKIPYLKGREFNKD